MDAQVLVIQWAYTNETIIISNSTKLGSLLQHTNDGTTYIWHPVSIICCARRYD